ARKVGMERADRGRFEAGAEAQGIHRMASGGEEMTAPAFLRADPLPPAVPISDVRQVLRARETDPAEPSLRPQPPREFQERVVAKLERDDGPHAGLPHGVANANQLVDVEARGLFEDEVLAGARRADGFVRM